VVSGVAKLGAARPTPPDGAAPAPATLRPPKAPVPVVALKAYGLVVSIPAYLSRVA